MAQLPAMDFRGRIERTRSLFPDAGIDALLVTNLTNVRYLTGFTGSAATLVLGSDGLVFTSDGRYGEQAAEQLGEAGVEAEIEIHNGAPQQEVVAAAGSSYGRLGLEADHVTWAQQRTYAERWFPGVELVATEALIAGLRRVKDAGELARIAAACDIADAAFAAVKRQLLDTPTEHEFALALEFEMRRRGADAVSFDAIVAAGPNGAKPHARPSGRRIERGELVVLDFGAKVDGYCSDMTRTVSVGEPSPEARRMYDVVLASQEAGRDAVRAGVAASTVDAACREVIADAGWADAFVHGTGHGVGLDIHEDPRVASTVGDTLIEGHVVTVEPGVYLPGQGGVRIEDTVAVTADGCAILTNSPKELVLE